MRYAAATAAIAVAGLFAAPAARADHDHYFGRDAYQLVVLTRDAAHEAAYLRGVPHYEHLRADLAELDDLARHIYQISRSGRVSRHHLEHDIEAAERHVDHVLDLLDDIEDHLDGRRGFGRRARVYRPAIGFGGGHVRVYWNGGHGGHGHGCHYEDYRLRHVEHLEDLLDDIEDTLDDLEDFVD